MNVDNRALFRASVFMFGSIVGAGVFALPGVFASVGPWMASMVYVLIAGIVLQTHLFYIDIVRITKHRETRFPSHVGTILGPTARAIAFFAHPGQIVGAGLAYLLLGGVFLNWFGNAVGIHLAMADWRVIFWVGGALTVFIGLRAVADVGIFCSWLLIACLFFLAGVYAQYPVTLIQASTGWHIADFGVMLFSLFGLSTISEVSDLAGPSRSAGRRAVALGSIGAAILMWLFAFFASRAVGQSATSFEVLDFIQTLPHQIQWIIPLAGFLAVSNVFVVVMQDLKMTFHRDAHWPLWLSWAVALGAPLLLLAITTNASEAIGFVGSVFTAINALLVCLMAFRLNRSRRIAPLLGLFFVFIILWRIISLI